MDVKFKDQTPMLVNKNGGYFKNTHLTLELGRSTVFMRLALLVLKQSFKFII
jgi:hypothetical protein